MLEFSNVKPKEYIDPVTGEAVTLRLLHRITIPSDIRIVNSNGRDLDLIALEEKGSYEELMNLCEANTTYLSENRFDITKMNEVIIPL
ncbi:hypothetical protein DQM68_19695 (plasmid) [Leptospira mayottensis]|uniref:Uncharacterized protein n=2 Tax=Leptospira mayottensis TaxID=1137606 RepID=A0A343URY1_9LEPT|nr:hypothetical protein [Leptospira mayottensis]AVH81554.1 hypothetical protein [Leptospira mayottensis 200901116]AXR62875.1 hypothetical protein DQM68_19695 [Leptospira mayottensis]TGN00372.1 hypothetical protein EHR03_13175 [Leptospira mayottensis]